MARLVDAPVSSRSESEAIREFYEHELSRPAVPPWAGLVLPDGTPVDPVVIGPSWSVGADGRWVLPKRTLGWQVLEWCGTWLQNRRGVPWQFTGEQARWLLWWFALDESLTEFRYRDAVLQRLKGWGKDPLAACLSAVELVGPCRVNELGDLRPDGNPVGVPHDEAWVQIAAVSQEQTKNTMRLFPRLFTPEAKAEFGLQVLKEYVYAFGGERMIQAVTSSPATLEGARSTFTLKNETQHWNESNDGLEMADVIERNSTKSEDGAARTLSITNAPEPSEDSVANRERDAFEQVVAGLAVDVGLLYDSLEAQPDAPLAVDRVEGESDAAHAERTRATISAVVMSVRGDATWLNLKRIVKSILDGRNAPNRSRRFWYNQVIATEDAWLSRQEWDAAALDWRPEPGSLITLGFDGSRTDDHSALIGCDVETGHLFQIGVWVPSEFTGEIDRSDVDRTVRWAVEEWDVVGFFSDVHPWESYVDQWGEDLGPNLCVKATPTNRVAFDMRKRSSEFVPAVEALHDGIANQSITHCGSKQFARHAYNCKRYPTRWGVSVWKGHRESARKIDAIPAAVLARLCRQAYRALPSAQQRAKPKTGAASFL